MKKTRSRVGTLYWIRQVVIVGVCGIGVSTYLSHNFQFASDSEGALLTEETNGRLSIFRRSVALNPYDARLAASARVAKLEGLLREAKILEAQAVANVTRESQKAEIASSASHGGTSSRVQAARFKASGQGAVDCDRGVECDLYTGKTGPTLRPPDASAAGLSNIDHNWPVPPFTDPFAQPKESFKGLYRCDVNTGCPTYSAAFLASKRQLLSVSITSTHLGNPIANMESASYHLFGRPGKTALWTSVDAFDFSVEHISMYERVLKSTKMGASPLRDAILAAYFQRLTLIERDQRLRCSEGAMAQKWHSAIRRREQEANLTGGGASPSELATRVVAVMPFYAVGTGSGHSIRDTKLKYLNITVHSIRCHFKSVVVAVSHPQDEQYVRHESGLPIHDVIVHKDLPRPSSTGMFTILRIQEKLRSDPTWAQFEYVFYTEADQILHLRTTQMFEPLLLANAHDRANAKSRRGSHLDQHQGSPGPELVLPALVVPHRFHSVPSASDFHHVDAVHNVSAVYQAMTVGGAKGGREGALLRTQKQSEVSLEQLQAEFLAKLKLVGAQRQGSDRSVRGNQAAAAAAAAAEGAVATTTTTGALLGAPVSGGVGTYVDVNAYEWYHPAVERSTIRRELNLYETRNLTRFTSVRQGDSCCFLRQADDKRHGVLPAEAGDNGGNGGGVAPHGSFATPVYHPNRDERLRPMVTGGSVETFAVGNGFAMVAGDCCFICVIKVRYCHTTCTPRRDGQGDCARGSFRAGFEGSNNNAP